MRRRYDRYNSKRRLREWIPEERGRFSELADRVCYGGNPEHKRNPGDFGLTPPSGRRKGKSLCDSAEIFTRRKALALLRSGLRKGMVSERWEGDWPQNIWAVSDLGIPLEAQLENSQLGVYHGYPMPTSDPLHDTILDQWKSRQERKGQR